MIAAAGRRLEQHLTAALAVRDVELPAKHRARTGEWRGGTATIHTRAYEGDRIRYARVVHVSGPDLAICNVLCLPAFDVDAPMLGIDLVQAREGHAVVVADLLPALPGVTAPTTAPLPLWAEQFFSPGAIVRRTSGDPAAALADAEAYARRFSALLPAAPRDAARASARARWQDAYCHAHRRDDRALGMLGRIFGSEWAAGYIQNVLFPVATTDPADLAVARLRAATRQAHADVESQVTLLRDDVSEPDYVTFLRATAACAVPIEARVAALAPPGVPLGCAAAVRAGWLRDDLHALAEELPAPVEIPTLSSWAEAVGAAYVLEGATLGGRVVLGHLSQRLPDTTAAASRYLRSYGDDVPRRWREVRHYVGTFMADDGHVERQVAAGALATFAAFARAYGHGATPGR